MPQNTGIPIIVQGNSYNLVIPLQIYIVDEGEMVLQDFTPDVADVVKISLKCKERTYNYAPTIVGNEATIALTGHEVVGIYAIEVVIVQADGTQYRSLRTDQFVIIDSSDDLTEDEIIEGLEENVIYINPQLFIAGERGRSIVDVSLTSTAGLVDTYTITYSDGTTSTFNVTNGSGQLVIVNDLTTGGADKALSAEMGKVLQGEVEGIKGVGQTPLTLLDGTYGYYNTSGAYVATQSTSYRNTGKVAIPAGCNKVVAYTQASTSMCAIAFFDSAGDFISESSVIGLGYDHMELYDADIPQNAATVAVDLRIVGGELSRYYAYMGSSEMSLLTLNDRIDNAVNAALNPIDAALTEVGYYGVTGAPNSNTKGRHSQPLNIIGYTQASLFGNNGSSPAIVFFDANLKRMTDLDVAGEPNISAVVNIKEKTDAGAVYAAFNVYNSNEDFSAYWCKFNVPSIVAEKLDNLNDAYNEMLPYKPARLAVSGAYIKTDGTLQTGVASRFKHTGRVVIQTTYDRIRLQTRANYEMAALAFYEADGTFISASSIVVSVALNLTTQVWDVPIPSNAAYYTASTSMEETFKCFQYNSSLWKDDWLGGVLVFGDSISDNGVSLNIVNNLSTTYQNSHNAAERGGRWQIDLAQKYNIKDLRSYAKSGAHWVDFDGATERQQLSDQISIAIGDSDNPNDVFLRDTFNPEIIIFAIGGNDALFITNGTEQLGSVTTAMAKAYGELDPTIFCDAMRKAFIDIQEQWPTAKVFCSIPPQRNNAANNTLLALSVVITEMCNLYSVRVIDSTHGSGISPANFDVVISDDGVHPNLLGQAMLADVILSGLGTAGSGAYVNHSQLSTKADKRTLVNNSSTSGSVELSANGYHDLGQRDSVSVTLPSSASRTDEFLFTFTCDTAACTLSLPSGVELGSELDFPADVAAGRKFQLSIMDGIALYTFIDE